MKNRRLLSVAIGFLLGVYPTPPAHTDYEEARPSGGALRIGDTIKPSIINPILTSDTISIHLLDLIFNGLVKLSDSLEPIPDLAESWEFSGDGKVWTFFLRKGVKFHDGTEFTAEDAKFTYEKVLELRGPISPAAVERYEVVNRYTFRAVLREPYSPFIYAMTWPIAPKHLLEGEDLEKASFNRHPVGTGPFKLAEWTDDDRIRLVANQEYFEGRPHLDSVSVVSYGPRDMLWAQLILGKIDLVTLIPPEHFLFVRPPKFKVYTQTSPFYYTFLFNLRDPLVSDRRIRQAINLILSPERIIEEGLGGHGQPCTGPFLPDSWPYNPDVVHPHDPDEAARLLDQAGWSQRGWDGIRIKDGRRLVISLLMDTDDELKLFAAQVMHQQLWEAGIDLEVRLIKPEILIDQYLRTGRFQAAFFQLNAGIDPDVARTFWHSGGIGRYNLASYRNMEVDRLFEQGYRAYDQAERKKIYRRIHALIVRDVPAVFLFIRQDHEAVNASFGGIAYSPLTPLFSSIKDWFLMGKGEKDF